MKPKTIKIFNVYNLMVNIVCICFLASQSFNISINAPLIMAIINEIMVNLDPVATFKGGRAIDPHDCVNWW